MKKRKCILCAVMLSMLLPISVSAHPGRTDSSGGHHDYKNRSGLGNYHYHHGMGAHLHPGGVCPYGGGTVSSYTPPTPPKPSISVNNPPNQLYIGDSSGLNITLSNAPQNTLSITSSNPNVVRVNPDNTLTAVGAGDTTITVSASGADNQAFVITVNTVPVETITIKNPTDRLQLNNTIVFETEVLPNNATDKTVTWKSENEEIAIVTDEGAVVGKKPGKTKIICEAVSGAKTEIELEVYEIFPESIKLEVNEIELECLDTYELDVKIMPETANNKNYSIHSENSEIAKIVNKKIEAVSDGETNIVIKTDNNLEKKLPIKVYHVPTDDIQIDDSKTDYFIDLLSIKLLDKRENINLETVIYPNNATFTNSEWKSSNENIIAIRKNKPYIEGMGRVTLTSTTFDKDSDSITIFVIDRDIALLIIFAISIIIVFGTGCIIYKYKKNIMVIKNNLILKLKHTNV